MIIQFSPTMLRIKRWHMNGAPAVAGWRLESRAGADAPELYKWDSGKITFYAIRYRKIWHNCPTFADVRKVLANLGYTGELPNEPEPMTTGAANRIQAENRNHYRTAEGEMNR